MKHIKMILIGFMVIAIFSFSTIAQAQSTPLTYKVKAGDKMSYKVNKLNLEGNTSETVQLNLANGQTKNVTLKQGDSMTYTICNITTSGTDQIVYAKESFAGETTTCGQVNPTSTQDTEAPSIVDLGLVYPVASNNSYYQNLVNQNSSEYSLSGNTFSTTSNASLFGIAYFYLQLSLDISTGWISSMILKSAWSNGTIIADFEVAQGSGSSPGFEFGPTLVLFGIIATVVILKRKTKQI